MPAHLHSVRGACYLYTHVGDCACVRTHSCVAVRACVRVRVCAQGRGVGASSPAHACQKSMFSSVRVRVSVRVCERNFGVGKN